MKFIDYIVGTWNKGLKYDEVVSRLQEDYDDMCSLTNSLGSQLDQANRDKELLREEIKSLLETKTINVLTLKDYYENKYGSAIWTYNYDGKGAKDVKNALKVDEEGEETLKDAASYLINHYGLTSGSKPEVVVESVMKYFMQKGEWYYTRDSKLFDKNEYWAPANDSWIGRAGDCDDLAILMHNLVYYIFEKLNLSEHYWRIKLCAGGTLVEGHAFNIWLGDDGEWYVVESTLDLKGSFRKSWLKTPMRFNNLYTNYWGFARKDRSWLGANSSLIPYEGDEQ